MPGNGDTGTLGGRKGTRHGKQQGTNDSFFLSRFPILTWGNKTSPSKQSSATLSPNLAVPLLTRSNTGYSVGRSTGLELKDLDSSHVCYLLDFREVT